MVLQLLSILLGHGVLHFISDRGVVLLELLLLVGLILVEVLVLLTSDLEVDVKGSFGPVLERLLHLGVHPALINTD